ncbi:Do family serine endopeptidase [Aestuariispira insulae]|uniref:Probable periplasmic serine endoprotease DegP-like n=1 Tax=Aestuariispira insulae TaxID=1461337 RepID=A0A3D9HXI3_9PROT|nr:Do family serine endopeptidase [Aestuariispira insulae]RED54204.1 serine protease Do [Aestuariispira insulae]
MTQTFRIAARALTPMREGMILPALLVISMIAALLNSPAYGRGTPDGFADLAEELLPSVVDIRAIQNARTADAPNQPQAESPFPPDSPFGDLFERFRRHGEGNQGPRRREAAGSGFVIDSDGIIVTNNHVIENADEIYVIFNDDDPKEYPAEILGRDEGVDLAVLKVKADRKMKAVKFGDSDKARVGEWTLAIGNPWGLGGSVTAGIISGRARDIDRDSFTEFLQTDTPINQGNSGGPLFNMKGEVIGVNTAIFTPTGGSIGLGFAIPSNRAKAVAKQLREFGTTRRGWLGVSIQNVSPDIAESVGLDEPFGAMVSTVYDNSPASRAGLEARDVILSFNDRRVDNSARLRRMVAATTVGAEVPVVVWRDGSKINKTVVLGEREKVNIAALSGGDPVPEKPVTSQALDSLGLEIAPVSDVLRQEFNLRDDVQGVVITDVRQGSGAEAKRLRPGMVIVGDAKGPVKSVAELRQRVEKAHEDGRRSVLLHVSIDGELSFVAIRFDNKEG